MGEFQAPFGGSTVEDLPAVYTYKYMISIWHDIVYINAVRIQMYTASIQVANDERNAALSRTAATVNSTRILRGTAGYLWQISDHPIPANFP